jgi:hypothetical protein
MKSVAECGKPVYLIATRVRAEKSRPLVEITFCDLPHFTDL